MQNFSHKVNVQSTIVRRYLPLFPLQISIAWSLGFPFDDFLCVVDVALERVWVKKPGEEDNIKE